MNPISNRIHNLFADEIGNNYNNPSRAGTINHAYECQDNDSHEKPYTLKYKNVNITCLTCIYVTPCFPTKKHFNT